MISISDHAPSIGSDCDVGNITNVSNEDVDNESSRSNTFDFDSIIAPKRKFPTKSNDSTNKDEMSSDDEKTPFEFSSRFKPSGLRFRFRGTVSEISKKKRKLFDKSRTQNGSNSDDSDTSIIDKPQKIQSTKLKKRLGEGSRCIVCQQKTENCIKPWLTCTQCHNRVNLYCSWTIRDPNCTIFTEQDFVCILCKMQKVTQHPGYNRKEEHYQKHPEKYRLEFVLFFHSINTLNALNPNRFLMRYIKISDYVISTKPHSLKKKVKATRYCWRGRDQLTPKQLESAEKQRLLYLPSNESKLHCFTPHHVAMSQDQIKRIQPQCSPLSKVIHSLMGQNMTLFNIKPEIKRYCYPLNGAYSGITTMDGIFTDDELQRITECAVRISNVVPQSQIVQQHPEAFDFKQTERTDRVKVYLEYGYTYGDVQAPQELPHGINSNYYHSGIQSNHSMNSNHLDSRKMRQRLKHRKYSFNERVHRKYDHEWNGKEKDERKQNVLYKTSLKMDSMECAHFVIDRIQKVMVESGLYQKEDFEPDQMQINRYGKHTGIETHFDEVSWFDFPIITLRLESESALHFGVRQRKERNPSLRIKLNVGTTLIMESWAAMKYRHCVTRKEHRRGHSTALIIRRIKKSAVRKCPRYIMTRYLKKKKTKSDSDYFGI